MYLLPSVAWGKLPLQFIPAAHTLDDAETWKICACELSALRRVKRARQAGGGNEIGAQKLRTRHAG
jgi:hypothetical protein